MRKSVRFSLLLMSLAGIAALSGCASRQAVVFQHEEFVSTDVHSQIFAGAAAATCEAARRALLSQGYVISAARGDLVRGQKNFQPDGEVHVQIEFHVVCAPNGKGSNSTTVFVNALQDRYSLKKTSNSASLGVGVLGSVSLPIGYSDESLVKVASETIQAPPFYKRFFALIDRYLELETDTAADDIEHGTETLITMPVKQGAVADS